MTDKPQSTPGSNLTAEMERPFRDPKWISFEHGAQIAVLLSEIDALRAQLAAATGRGCELLEPDLKNEIATVQGMCDRIAERLTEEGFAREAAEKRATEAEKLLEEAQKDADDYERRLVDVAGKGAADALAAAEKRAPANEVKGEDVEALIRAFLSQHIMDKIVLCASGGTGDIRSFWAAIETRCMCCGESKRGRDSYGHTLASALRAALAEVPRLYPPKK